MFVYLISLKLYSSALWCYVRHMLHKRTYLLYQASLIITIYICCTLHVTYVLYILHKSSFLTSFLVNFIVFILSVMLPFYMYLYISLFF